MYMYKSGNRSPICGAIRLHDSSVCTMTVHSVCTAQIVRTRQTTPARTNERHFVCRGRWVCDIALLDHKTIACSFPFPASMYLCLCMYVFAWTWTFSIASSFQCGIKLCLGEKKIVILIGHFHCAGPSKPTVATSTPSIYLSSCLFIHLSIQPSQTHTH